MIETTLKAFSDGFGCMAVTDVSETESDIVQLLIDESPWEVIDGVDRLPKGHYEITVTYWWEDNFPDPGAEIIAEMTSHKIIENADQPPKAVPEGYVLMPADHLPEDMEDVAIKAAREYMERTGGNCINTIYKALVDQARLNTHQERES